MIKFFKKSESSFFMPFLTGMNLDICIFLAICQKSKTVNIYISDEAVHSQTARQIDDQTDKKETFHRTTTLQAGPINQVENDCF